jgi:hypothetical protein
LLSPSPLLAVTLHVYVLPFESPPTTMGEPVADCVPGAPPSLDVQLTANPVIVRPLSGGAANVTVMDALPATTVGCAGASGTLCGSVVSEAADGAPSPSALVAVTVQVYVLPFVRFVTVIGEFGPVLDPGAPPSLEVQFAV